MTKAEASADSSQQKLKLLIYKKKELEKRIRLLDDDIFKYESAFLELSQGSPITQTIESFINSRIDKKKYNVNDGDRIFSKNFPKSSRL